MKRERSVKGVKTCALTIFFFKQKTAYEIYQCDWSSDVCSSDLVAEETKEGTIQLAKSSVELAHLADDLNAMVGQFKI